LPIYRDRKQDPEKLKYLVQYHSGTLDVRLGRPEISGHATVTQVHVIPQKRHKQE
jgi:hypothetical protein